MQKDNISTGGSLSQGGDGRILNLDYSTMHTIDITRRVAASPKGGLAESEVPYSSNCIRLSLAEWFIVAVVVSALLFFAPALWQRVEKFDPDPDYRIPLDLSSDYSLYRRWSGWACSNYETLLIGDSVVWGHYVSKDNTLSHYLNQRAGRNNFANLGVDGTRPAVLEGLLRYYARSISGKKVILHLNPLWMSSPKHDLQTDKEHHFNHAKLAPQFFPKIPCYRASYSERISAVVERHVPFFNWTSHLNIAYFNSNDLPTWTIDHPYDNPLKAVTFQLPRSDNYDKSRRTSPPGTDTARDGIDWVGPDTSLQWRFFRSSVELLKARGNTVFVLVGPFNEHILKQENLDKFSRTRAQIELWLRRSNIPYFAPPVLPAEFYRDASHPLSPGYAALANQLFDNDAFKSTILNPKDI